MTNAGGDVRRKVLGNKAGKIANGDHHGMASHGFGDGVGVPCYGGSGGGYLASGEGGASNAGSYAQALGS